MHYKSLSSYYKVINYCLYINVCLHLAQGVLCNNMVICSIAAEHTIFFYINSNSNFDTDFVDLKVTIIAFMNVYTRLHKAWSLVSRDMLTHGIAADHVILIHNELILSNY